MKVAINWDILIYPVFRTRLVAQAWQTSKLRSLLRDHFVSCLGAPSLPRSKIKPKSSTQTLQSSGSGRLMCCNLSEKGTELESCCDCGKIRQSTPHFTHSIYPCLCAWCHGDELTTFAWFTSTIFYHLLPSSTAFGLCFMAFMAFMAWGNYHGHHPSDWSDGETPLVCFLWCQE